MANIIKKSQYAKNHFALNRWILKYAGLWTPDFKSKSALYFYRFYAIFIFLFVNVYFTSTEFLAILDTYGNYDFLIKNINFALTHLMGAIKCIFWQYNGKQLINIIQTLEDEKWHYECSSKFNPAEISINSKKTGIKYTFSFFMLAHMTLSSSYIPPLISAIFEPNYIEDINGNVTFDQMLPYFSWMPFNYNTPYSYILALGYQAGPMFSYAYSIVGMDTLFMNIMNYISTHLLILQGAFRTIRVRSIQKLSNENNVMRSNGLHNSKELDLIMAQEIRKCCKHLQMVTNMCDKLENLHTFLTFGQVMATLFILCTSLFLVSTTPVATKQFAAECVYMIAMGFQLVLYCWFGNEVSNKALELPMALWHGDWLASSKSFRTSMLITMIRMKRPLYLSVGKFAPLTLTTFGAILKASYSFFAVLKKVND